MISYFKTFLVVKSVSALPFAIFIINRWESSDRLKWPRYSYLNISSHVTRISFSIHCVNIVVPPQLQIECKLNVNAAN